MRFCPSPTGTPHVGLVRTALFNWAYARHTGGKLIFRIEDTDAARDSEESYLQLLDALRWLHLDWDEGVEIGGPHEPYRQSQRTEIYLEMIERLTASGHLYESFVTPEEMEARNVANGRDPKQGYDNFERDLTDAERDAFKAEGREPALRLRVPDTDLSFDDLVRGEITFPAGSFTDFVVVRPNGAPLYTFVNPVDDALMGITHVLRGEDLLSSTPRQIALYRALIEIGVTEFIPRFGHLPYVMGDGNKKLSKRDPQSDLFLHREKGFIPEGLVNYLALLGWSIAPDRDVFSMDELVDAFDVVNVNPNPARFDEKKAESINGDHIRLLDADDFAARLEPYLDRARGDRRRPRAAAPRGPARAGAHAAARRGPRPARVPVHARRRARHPARGDAGRRSGRGAGCRDHRAHAGSRLDHRRDRGRAAHPPHRRTRAQAARRVRPAAFRDLGPPDQPAAVRVDGAARPRVDPSRALRRWLRAQL